MCKILQEKLVKFYEKHHSNLNNSLFFQHISVYFKLNQRFNKENNIINKGTPNSHSITGYITSFPSYFFQHFHFNFLKDTKTQISNDSDDDKNYIITVTKSKIKKLDTSEYLKVNKHKKIKIENFLHLFLYFNSKLLRWKECFFEDEIIENTKCKICENEVKLKYLGMHSYTCAQRYSWTETIKDINIKLQELEKKLNYLLVQFTSKIDDKISSPLTYKVMNMEEELDEIVN